MDTSETYGENIVNPLKPLEKVERVKWYEDPVYIKMCDCPEIQKQATPFEHRLDYGKTQDFWHDIWWTEKIEGQLVNGKPIYNFKSKHIWLPRQDQLQEMSKIPWRAFDMLCLEMANPYGSAKNVETKEQVGLMAIMNLKYTKVWDGEKWK